MKGELSFLKLSVKNFFFSLLFILSSLTLFAHEVRPAYFEITENTNGNVHILWKQPTMGEVAIKINPRFSAFTLTDSLAKVSVTESYLVKEWDIVPPHAPLSNQTITIEGLQSTITDVLVRITFADGNVLTKLIHPADPHLVIQPITRTIIPVWEYLQLGIMHIWTGVDHLLFVLGLILLVKGRRKLIWTITSFTIAHSITLALATLGVIHVPSAPVEACIALSIMFVGVELIHNMQGRMGLASKFPWLVAFTFGLLHGLGFAGALAQVGLPHKAIPLALFLFNVGVEIGQLAFVFLVLSIIWLFRNYLLRVPTWMKWIPPYVIGSMAAFWFVERTMGIFIH